VQVRTLSFRNGSRFWEISWSGLEVEIVSGTVGKSGRATQHLVASVTELQAFVEKRVAAAKKKGFVAADEQAPTPDHSERDTELGRALRTLKKWERTAYLPVLESRPIDPASALGDKFGGMPWISDAAPWPELDGEQMEFLFQLELAKRLRSFPKGLLLQCFYSWKGDYASYDPWAPTACVRFVRPKGRPVVDPLAELYPENAIVDYTERIELPGYASRETREELAAIEHLLDPVLDVDPRFDRRGDKLGGWPDFIQDEELVRCRICGEALLELVQIESGRALPLVWGDMGVAYVVACPKHLTEATLFWQCH
jgi:uncharacterized protein YwqG/predicted DNA-binding WGR domain protein